MARFAESEKVTECERGDQAWGKRKVKFCRFDSYSLKDLPLGLKIKGQPTGKYYKYQ